MTTHVHFHTRCSICGLIRDGECIRFLCPRCRLIIYCGAFWVRRVSDFALDVGHSFTVEHSASESTATMTFRCFFVHRIQRPLLPEKFQDILKHFPFCFFGWWHHCSAIATSCSCHRILIWRKDSLWSHRLSRIFRRVYRFNICGRAQRPHSLRLLRS
jgi:hypothetical protein